MNTSEYLVTPTHVSGMKAPFIVVEVQRCETEKQLAAEKAKQQSRLADFPEWTFVAEYNRWKRVRRGEGNR